MDLLKRMVYPGRFVCVGVNEKGDESILVYGITGRSPPSQARKLVFDGDDKHSNHDIKIEVTDEKLLSEGNPDLLVYPAISFRRHGIAVSNGKQTNDIAPWISSNNSLISLVKGHEKRDFEPDKPNYTPRISAALDISGRATLGIIRRAKNDSNYKQFFEVPMIPGEGSFMSTYDGIDRNPLVSFIGEPLTLPLIGRDAIETARLFYTSLPFTPEGKDYRVAVAAVHVKRRNNLNNMNDPKNYSYHIINRAEL